MARLYMQVLHRVLNMSQYDSVYLINASMCLNVPQCALMLLSIPEHGSILLNVPECA